MTDFHEIDALQNRLSTMIDVADLGDGNARELASEALEELAVVIEGLQAQNAELIAGQDVLDQERQRYHDLFESVPDGYLITNSAGVVLEVNGAACSMFGHSRNRVIGKPLAQFIDVHDRRAFHTQLNRIRQAGVGGHLAFNLAVRDHSTVPANLRATLSESRSDGPSDIKWLIRDRRHDMVSEALRESEERLRATFDSARVGIMLCDTGGEILFINPYADMILDRDRPDTTLTDWLRTTHPDDLAAVEAMMQAVSDDAEPGSVRHRLVHRNGDLRWVDHSVAPFRDADRRHIGFVSTLIDITNEHDAMTDLYDSRNFTAALLDTVGALVVVVDREGRILRFNKTCETLSGFSAEDVVGRSMVDMLIPPEQRVEVADVIADLLTSTTNNFENDWITVHGGRRRIAWTNTSLIGSDGKVAAIIGTGIDITEQRLVESRLAQADRLDSIGRLTAGIAHDFNNTLTTLRLRIDRLGTRELDGDSRVDVDAIANTIDRTQALITDLLSFSSQQNLMPTLVDINAEITRISGVLSSLLGSDVVMQIDLTDDDTNALIDPARFEQIVVNLAINARDAMPGGGTLTFATTIETIEPHSVPSRGVPWRQAAGSYIVVSVADTGIGIDPNDLPRIFDPYFTTKPPGKGTGLGLATTYGSVNQSGGAILVDSDLGRGTTLSVWLPRSTERQPATAVLMTEPITAPESTVVLVVEDDDDLRGTLLDELRGLGHLALAAANGTEALRQIETPIDILVTDVQLPDINGREIATRFVQRWPELSIVYMSGAPESQIRKLLPADAVLLRKPFSNDVLIATLGLEH